MAAREEEGKEGEEGGVEEGKEEEKAVILVDLTFFSFGGNTNSRTFQHKVLPDFS